MRRAAAVLLLAAAAAGCASTGAAAVRPYPLDRCLVTDTRLGSMGDPIVIVHGDREIKFCCPPCVDEFRADPEKFLKLLPK
jgi:hypothetical protein